jgi:hypothetical protein
MTTLLEEIGIFPGETPKEALARMERDDPDFQRPTFMDKNTQSHDYPALITKATAYDIFGWRPGETLDEAIARTMANTQAPK